MLDNKEQHKELLRKLDSIDNKLDKQLERIAKVEVTTKFLKHIISGIIAAIGSACAWAVTYITSK